jgi:hypothetical protein
MAETQQEQIGKLKGDEFVSKAYTLFEEFKSAYESEWSRLEQNDRFYLGQHWDDMQVTDSELAKPMTPVINSTVENLKADLADNFPQAIVQPEAPEDQVIADIVGALIRQNHDSSNYRREYMMYVHDILVGGYGVQEVGYDATANRNIGAAFIRYVNSHNILFDPQVTDFQLGRGVFKIMPQTLTYLESRYPDYAGKFAQDTFSLKEDNELTYDQTKSILMIEFWFKEWIEEGDTGHWAVHMAQMAGRQLLADSREEKPEGYFSMGEYPFIITPLFRRKNSCLGYGIPDLFGDTQKYSDKLDQIVLKNAALSAHNKLLNGKGSGFDTWDLQDWSKDVHEGNDPSLVTWMQTPPLPNYIIAESGAMRQTIKEESGANDFSRGNTASGVTAASAIAALQEMSSKRSRMIAMAIWEDYKTCVRYEIEFEREFNVLPREVLLTVNGQQVTATFESAIMERQSAFGNGEIPIEFMISIKVERENKFTTTAHNELVLQMVQLGVLTPAQALELMVFEGKEQMLSRTVQQGPSPEELAMMQAQEQQAALDQQIANLPQPMGGANAVDISGSAPVTAVQ